MPGQIPAEIVVKALQRLPRGSSGGASAWTYEHIKAACACPWMLEATLQFMNHIEAVNLPHFPHVLSCQLVPLKKEGTADEVRPIAVSKVRLRLAAVSAMEACPTKPSLCS